MYQQPSVIVSTPRLSLKWFKLLV